MPRLDFSQRVVSLYLDRQLSVTKNKYSILKEMSQLISRWIDTGWIDDKAARIRKIKNTKITVRKLSALDDFIFKDMGMGTRNAKDIIRLRSCKATIGRYLKILDWRKIKSKYCRFVGPNNRVERIVYATPCQASNMTYNDSILIDESTRQCSRNAPMQWFHNYSDETRKGIIPWIVWNDMKSFVYTGQTK